MHIFDEEYELEEEKWRGGGKEEEKWRGREGRRAVRSRLLLLLRRRVGIRAARGGGRLRGRRTGGRGGGESP